MKIPRIEQGGEAMNKKGKISLYPYFDYLRGVFNQYQAFIIMLGIATIKWMEHTEKYACSAKLITRALLENGHLEHEVTRHENEFPEFDGILSALLSRLFSGKGGYLKEIYHQLDDKDLRTKKDFQELINQAVQLDLRESGLAKTPHSVASLVAKLQDLDGIDSFADLCAGISSIALEIFRQSHHQPYYYAEGIDSTSCIISRLLMIVNGVESYEIVNKDIFNKNEIGGTRQFDLVISDIPRNLKYHKPLNAHDPRFRYGIPRQGNMEWAVIQNVIYHMNEWGKGVVIGSKGMLVRSYENEIRAAIIEEDLIECVITLPDNLYEKTNIGTEVMILNRYKPLESRGRILFINAEKYKKRLNSYQDMLTEEGIRKIVGAYHFNKEEEGFSKFVPIEEMAKYDYRLNPVEYIEYESLKNQFDQTIPLGEIAEITRGVNVTKKELESLEKDGEYYYLNIRNIDEGDINYEDATRIKPKSWDWLERYSIQPGDILITAKGWETKAALVDNDFKDSFISSNLTRIRVDRSKYNPYILLEFLQSEIGKRMLESIQTGTTITLINNKQLSRMEVPVYPKEMMDEIGRSIKKNQTIYKEKVKEAEQQYEGKRDELLMKLGLDNSLEKN
jgi:type I restriction enzyme M protein